MPLLQFGIEISLFVRVCCCLVEKARKMMVRGGRDEVETAGEMKVGQAGGTRTRTEVPHAIMIEGPHEIETITEVPRAITTEDQSESWKEDLQETVIMTEVSPGTEILIGDLPVVVGGTLVVETEMVVVAHGDATKEMITQVAAVEMTGKLCSVISSPLYLRSFVIRNLLVM